MVRTSFDASIRDQVPLNCISKREGIKVSLYHKAKGGLTVMLEEKIGEGGLLDAAILRNLEEIQVKQHEYPPVLQSYALSAARNFVLSKDKEFHAAISEKAHRTALFVFKEIGIEDGENMAIDGCKEIGREEIDPTHIQFALVSEDFMAETSTLSDKLTYLKSIDQRILFSYKDEQDNPHIIEGLPKIKVPNYKKFLKNLAYQKPSLIENSIYTHMTRL